MRIVKFSAENIKKLKAVEITPAGNLVEITGPNGSGKSSVLDSIFYALGGSAEIPNKIVRKGEEKAKITLDLGELIVTRKFTAAGGTSLVVEATNGARFPSPQRMLDDLIGSLSFDPLAFTRMEPRDQLETLRRMVKMDVDIEMLDRQSSGDVEKRRDINREVKQLEARITGLNPESLKDVSSEPLDVDTLIAALEAVGVKNTELEKKKARLEADRIANDDCFKKAKSLRLQAGAKQREASQLEEIAKEYIAKADEIEKQAEEDAKKLNVVMPAPESTVEIRASIEKAQVTNRKVSSKQQLLRLEEEAAKLKEKAAALTKAIEDRTEEKNKAISSAKMPVEGLSFGEGEVIYNELPLVNASSAEQLRISVAIAIAANPKLKVLRVKDGSLLDEASLKQLAEFAALEDYQIWIERVEEGHGRPCIIMEDGAIAQGTAKE